MEAASIPAGPPASQRVRALIGTYGLTIVLLILPVYYAIKDLSDQDGLGLIGLVGSSDLPGVALRRAQSILRWDRRPSLWSHAFLIVEDGIREVTVHSRAGHFPEPADNAITPATLEHYAEDPNVAVLKVRTTDDEARDIQSRATTEPNLERLRYDLFEALGFWQAYLWTRGTPNPLEAGIPMASSALVEYPSSTGSRNTTPPRASTVSRPTI